MDGIWPGVYTFRRFIVQQLQKFHLLASQPCPHWTAWGKGAYFVPGAVLIATTVFTILLSFYPLDLGTDFVRCILSVPSSIPIHCPHPLWRFQPILLDGAPAWRLHYVPCSLALIGSIVSCTQCLVGYVRYITIFFIGEGDSVEVWPFDGFLLEVRLETPRLLGG